MGCKTFVEQLNEATTKNPSTSSTFGFVENNTLFSATY